MTAEFEYFVDHLPTIITAVFSGISAVLTTIITTRQVANTRNTTETNNVAKQIRHDLNNGVGQKIAETAVQHIKPALQQAADVTADKIVKKADEVASVLANADSVNGMNARAAMTGATYSLPVR